MKRFNELRDIRTTYLVDAYTGAQVRVFVGSIWVDDIIAFQWSSNQSKTPIYGYNSTEYDAVLRGNFLVEGSFSIAFTEQAYLELIRKVAQGEIDQNEVIIDYILSKQPTDFAIKDRSKIRSLYYYRYLNDVTPAVGYIQGAVNSPVAIYRNIAEFLSNYADPNLSEYENMAEILEDYLWGGKWWHELSSSNIDPNSLARWDNQINRLRRIDEADYSYDSVNDEISILGTGNNAINFVLLYGDMNVPAAEHTVKNIYDVHIVGESQNITVDDVVVVTYTFFARHADVAIGNLMKQADTVKSDDIENQKPIQVEEPTKKEEANTEVVVSGVLTIDNISFKDILLKNTVSSDEIEKLNKILVDVFLPQPNAVDKFLYLRFVPIYTVPPDKLDVKEKQVMELKDFLGYLHGYREGEIEKDIYEYVKTHVKIFLDDDTKNLCKGKVEKFVFDLDVSVYNIEKTMTLPSVTPAEPDVSKKNLRYMRRIVRLCLDYNDII